MNCRCRVIATGLIVALATWPGVTSGKSSHSSGSHSSSHHSSGGSVSVRGYTRKDGTYVAPHMRSAPDHSFSNNWSTRGNVNPYTGKVGTKTSPSDSSSSAASYASSLTRTTARTSYRTSARSGYHLGAMGGGGNGYEDDDVAQAEADDTPSEQPIIRPIPTPIDHPQLPTRYIAHFRTGKTKPITDFADENGGWMLYGITGGRIKYLTSMIAYFEPTPDALGVMRKWTDSAGSHHATAKFVRIDRDKVILTKDDGKTIHVPVDKLSETDQDLARRLQELDK